MKIKDIDNSKWYYYTKSWPVAVRVNVVELQEHLKIEILTLNFDNLNFLAQGAVEILDIYYTNTGDIETLKQQDLPEYIFSTKEEAVEWFSKKLDDLHIEEINNLK